MRGVVIALALLLAATGCGKPPPPGKEDKEICGNAVDDDGNGLTDCEDPVCAEEVACKVVAECHQQMDCLNKELRKYRDYINDPIPLCVNKKCVRPERQIDMNFYAQTTSWGGTQIKINSVNTRFVKMADVNGGPVTCATLAEVAPSHLPEDADQIERTGRFNLQAYDTTSMSTEVPGGQTVQVPLMNVSTGADFIIWTELWSQKLSSNTQLPQGKRWGWSCTSTGGVVAEVVSEDHRTRGITVVMPQPQNFP